MNIDYVTEAPPLDRFFSLFQATGWYRSRPVTPDDLACALANSQFMVAAYDGAALVGFGRILTDYSLHAMIYDLIVAPAYQNQGIGGKILELLLAFCREHDIRDVQLFCAKGKRPFYEKRGFFARPDDAPGMQYSAAFMRRQLSE